MPGASTDTEMATASQVLSAPRASVLAPSVTIPGPAGGYRNGSACGCHRLASCL